VKKEKNRRENTKRLNGDQICCQFFFCHIAKYIDQFFSYYA
jgi:hypothetical protein